MVTLAPITLGAYTPPTEVKKLFGIFKPTPQTIFLSKLITGKTTAEERAAELKKFATGLAIAAVPVLAAVFPGAAAAVAKPVISTIVKKPVLAIAGAGLIVSGAAPKVIKTIFKAGEVTGEVITGEKELTAETIADVGKGLGIALGIGAVGTAAGLIGKKILEKDVPTLEELPALPSIPQEIEGLVITPTAPITPETVYMEEPVKIIEEKKPSEPRRAKITQRVNVEVGVKQSAHRITQKYINAVPY